MRVKFLSLLMLLMSFSVKGAEYDVDGNGNVVFTSVVESLNLNKDEIRSAALKYLENAYKDTKYKIIQNEEDSGVMGEGAIVGFHQQGGLAKSKTYSIRFYLRVDAKDRRARIRFIARNYEISTLADIGSDGKEEVLISECKPVGTVHNDKGHQQAFEKLSALAAKTLTSMEKAIKDTVSSSQNNDDW